MLRVFALALIAALAITSANATAQEAWGTFTSKEGQFTVELPGKPTINQSRVRKGDGGSVITTLVGCKTEAGIYMAYKMILPTSIVKGSEDAELDAERDGLAKEWNGKVIAERKILAENKVGRDFTVRGKPDVGEDTITIRVREYLAGNSVFMMAVISAPNRELPESSGRFLGSLALGEEKVRAQGTPTPDPQGVEVPGWGVAIDPYKDCEFVPDGKRLRLNITGSRHQQPGALQPGSYYIPRIMHGVEGDFVITVKVGGEFRPGGKSTHPKNLPFNGAGLLIWSDPENNIRVERAAINRGGKFSTYVNFEEFEGGTRAASHNEGMKEGDCWLRMERKGSRLQGSLSFDGTTWKNLAPIQTVWPAKLKIGLTASSSSGLPFSVIFDEFELKANVK